MPSEYVNKTDVLVIGGSMAGLFAAIKAREQGAKVTLVDKGYIGRSGAALFAVFYSVFHPDWGHDFQDWMTQIAKLGEYLNNPEWTEITLKDSYDRFMDLQSWGVKFAKNKNGDLLTFPGRGTLNSIAYGTGRTLLPMMRKQAEKIGVNIMDRIMITDLVKQEGVVSGAVGFDTINGDFHVIEAKATVMCTGGGALGGNEHIGSRLAYNGETMAYKAGAQISGKEFSLTGLGPGCEPAGANKDSEKISLEGKKIKSVSMGFHPLGINHYVDAYGNRVGRNTAAAAVHQGRGPILWNLDAARTEEIDMAIFVTEKTMVDMSLEYEIDLKKRGVYAGTNRYESYIGHAVEGGGSGIWSSDTGGATGVPGLYAAGDCYNSRAVGSLYPSFGMGTRNAAVTGARAGQSAADYARRTGDVTADRQKVTLLKNEIYQPMDLPGGFDTDWVTLQLKSIMVPYYVWVIRHGDRLKAALTMVEFLKNHISPKIYNKLRDAHGLRLVHETKSRILGVEMMLRSAIFRTESRGVHYREDYPRRDDPDWLAIVKVRDNEGAMELVKESLPEKWWPDLSLPYRQRYPSEYLNELPPGK